MRRAAIAMLSAAVCAASACTNSATSTNDTGTTNEIPRTVAGADTPQVLPGVDDRSTDGDPTTLDRVLDEDDLAKFDTLADPTDCDATLTTSPASPTDGEVTIVITSIVDGCFSITAESGSVDWAQDRITELEAMPSVVAAAQATSATELQADDPDSGDQWFLDSTDSGLDVSALDRLEQRQSSPVTVAVVDPGTFADHNDITAHPVGHAPWEAPVTDHATHVAGVIAATAGNGIEGRGVARNVRLLDVPVVGATLQEAISWAVDNGAQVINMSLCESDPSDPDNVCADKANAATAAVIENARRRGVLIMAAAGNCGNVQRGTSAWVQCDGIADKQMWPAAYPRVLGVAAYERNGERSWFSTANHHVDVSAPGGDILSTTASGNERWRGGTSQASPMVAGSAAVLIGHRPDVDPARILSGLFAQSKDAGPPGWDTFYGAGRIDPLAVAEHLNDIEPWQPPTSDPNPPAPESAPLAEQVAFAFSTSEGWEYEVRLAPNASYTFSKDVSSDPPGKATLVVDYTTDPVGVIEGTIEGRSAPPLALAISYVFEAYDVATTLASQNAGACAVKNWGVEVLWCSSGPFGLVEGSPGSNYSPAFEERSGQARIKGMSEDSVDQLVESLRGVDPVTIVSVLTSDMWRAIDGGCTMFVSPDGHVTDTFHNQGPAACSLERR